MRRIANSLPGLIAYVDKEERYRFNNAAYETWLGVPRDQAMGRPMREVLGDLLYERLSAPIATALGGQTATFETELPAPDGENRYVNGVYVPSHHEDGTVRGFYALITDITARRRAELELQDAYRNLQQKTLEMEQFVYTVSHDLKSPLVTILGFVGVLREDFGEGDSEQFLESVGRIERAAHRMDHLIEGLLELGRIGRVSNKPETIDVGELCRQIVAENERRLKEVRLCVEIEPLPHVVADRARLAEVFDNLLSNGIKYGVGGQQPRMTIGGLQTGGEVLFFVRDNGPGIAAEYHEKIFGLFQRLDSQSEGTGLGLAIVAKIMESHGGRAWVESAAGHGATFWIAFPA
jgi:PAS domain S-box-containing protein